MEKVCSSDPSCSPFNHLYSLPLLPTPLRRQKATSRTLTAPVANPSTAEPSMTRTLTLNTQERVRSAWQTLVRIYERELLRITSHVLAVAYSVVSTIDSEYGRISVCKFSSLFFSLLCFYTYDTGPNTNGSQFFICVSFLSLSDFEIDGLLFG